MQEASGERKYTVYCCKIMLDSHKNWEFKYCKCYCIVLHIMLFLIDFLKKDVNFLPVFSAFFPHYVCVPSLYRIWPPAPSMHWITMRFFKKRKNKNKQTIRSVFHFSQAFIRVVRAWWWLKSLCTQTHTVPTTCTAKIRSFSDLSATFNFHLTNFHSNYLFHHCCKVLVLAKIYIWSHETL